MCNLKNLEKNCQKHLATLVIICMFYTVYIKYFILQFYKCSTQNDCSKCLSIGSKYKCGWCASKQMCSISQLCEEDFKNFSYQCPYHSISVSFLQSLR